MTGLRRAIINTNINEGNDQYVKVITLTTGQLQNEYLWLIVKMSLATGGVRGDGISQAPSDTHRWHNGNVGRN